MALYEPAHGAMSMGEGTAPAARLISRQTMAKLEEDEFFVFCRETPDDDEGINRDHKKLIHAL